MTQVTPTQNLKECLKPDQIGMHETQLQNIKRQLKVVDREQHQFCLHEHNTLIFPFALIFEAAKL